MSHKAHLLSYALRCSSKLQKIQNLENFVSMAIQGTQVPMYTNTHCFCIFLIFLCVSLRFCLSYTLRLVACCRRRQKILQGNTYTVHLSALPLTCLNASELQVKHVSELQGSFICLQRAEGPCPLHLVPTQLALAVRQSRLNARL